jgi:hypothetical protein
MVHDDDQNDGWIESTEGDLDPDLTEEAGYLAWDRPEPRSNWFPFVSKVVILLVVVALIGSVVLPALT